MIDEHRTLARAAVACSAVLVLLAYASLSSAARPADDDDDLIILGIPKVTLSLTNPPANNVYTAPASIAMTATAKVAAGSIPRVDYYQGPSLIGTATASPYSFTWSTVAAGQYALTARARSTLGFSASSTPVNVKVCGAPTVTLTAPAANTIVDEGTSFDVQAAPVSPGGFCKFTKVEFYKQGTSQPIGTSLGDPPYHFNWTNLVAGTYTLFARAYDEAGQTTDSPGVVFIVNAKPVVSLIAPTANAIFDAGTAISLKATASDPDGTITKVEFFGNSTSLGVGTLSSGQYVATWTGVAGSYAVTAKATDNRNATNVSTPAVNIVVCAPPTVAITSPTAAVILAPATFAFTATASSQTGCGSISQIVLYNGATQLGTYTASPATYQFTNLAAGTYTLKAVATDTRGKTGQATFVLKVNAAPTVTWVSPSSPPKYAAAAGVVLKANAADAGGGITGVDFYYTSPTTKIGSGVLSSGTYNYTWTGAAAGTYSMFARATDTDNATKDTTPLVALTLCGVPTTGLTQLPQNNTFVTQVLPGSFTLSATASSPNGICNISKVEFFDGGALIGTATTPSNGVYSVSWNTSVTGSHNITAKVTDEIGQTFTTAVTTVTVILDRPPTISSITPTSAQVLFGDSISFTVVVADQDSGNTLTVQLLNGGTPVGSVTQLAGTNTFVVTWVPGSAGTYNLTVQVTDNYGLSATQAASATVSSVPSGTVGDADLVSTTPVPTSNVGTTAGVFGVGESGAATYSIPIQVPPGTAGLQPSLALNYSSQGGDGHLGAGWALSGLSVIARCPATEAQDGARLGINYDDQPSDDAFCLDGQRLIPVGQTVDKTQTEYRTEIDGFARIARYEDTFGLVAGPARFRVWTKAGQILDYGSRWWVVNRGWYQRIQPTRLNSVKFWVLDRVRDRVGNYMEIDYAGTNNAVTPAAVSPPPPFSAPTQPLGAFPDTEYWPSVIRYYGVHDVGVSSPGYNEVRFVVTNRATVAPLDVQRFFDQGAGEATLTKKLDAIQVTVDKSGVSAGTLVRSYYLNYAPSATSKRLLLQNVQECAPDSTGICLTATTFGWSTMALNFQGQGSTSAVTSIASDHAYNVKVADMYGDGRSDMIRYAGSSGGLNNWEVCKGPLAQGGACQTFSIASYGDNGDVSRWLVADIEGTGKADLITYDGSTVGSQNWKVCPFNSSGFDACQPWTGPILFRTNSEWNEFFWGDFDGDGRIDIMSFTGNVVTDATGTYNLWDVCFSTGTGFNCQRSVRIPQIIASGNLRNRVLIADMNGDGKADYLERASQNTTENRWNICLADFGPAGTASQQFVCPSGFSQGIQGDFDKFVVMDMNGDGLADMTTRVDVANVPAGESCIATNTCWQVCLAAGDGAFQFYDPAVQWTDQGLVDGSGNPVDPYAAPRCRYWSGLNAAFNDVLYGDFNGDGRTDMAAWDKTNRWWTVCHSTGANFTCSSAPNNFPMPPGLDSGTNNDRVRTGDFNGDGKTDIIVQNTQTSWALGYAGDGFADQIQTITTGLGATTSIAYTPLTDTSVYKKGNATIGARELLIQSPLYVVKETQASNALGGQFVNTYFYEGLKGRTDGRGIEGFFRRRMLDGNGILSEVEIEQTWPLTGRPRRTSKWAPVSGNRPDPTTVLPTSPVDVANAALVKVNEATQTWSSRSYGAGSPYQGGTIGAIAEPRSFARFVYQVHLTGSTEQSFEFPAGTALPETSTTIPLVQIDAFGNVQQITASTFDPAEGGNYTKLTQNTYSNDGPNWIIGRLTSAKVTLTKPTGENTTRNSSWTYGTTVPTPDHPFDNACWWGFVCRETIEPGHAGDTTNFGLWQETQYTYDRFGNKVAATVSFQEKDASGAVVVKQRTTYSCYANSSLCAGAGDGAANNRGRFTLSVTNALSQTETRRYDTRFGAASIVNGPNGLSSTVLYDNLGRKVSAAAFDGQNGTGHRLAQSETMVQSCASADTNPGPGVPASQTTSYTTNSACQAGEKYRVRTKASGNAASYVFFDNLQRERRTLGKAFNDQQWATVATTYDALGRKSTVAKPAGSGTITATLGYDVLNRVTTETTTGNGGGTRTIAATTTYSGLTTSVQRTNPSGSGLQTTSRTVNSQGQITRARDANNKDTTFLYDAFGNLKQATGPTGIAVTMSYDLRGRKASMVDPDMGSWNYFYNGVGELTRQRDGKGQDTRLIYDALGRMSERREYAGPEGSGNVIGTLWAYDSCAAVAVGKLCSTEAHSAFPYLSTNLISKQVSTYDSAAHPATTTTTIGNAGYISAMQYDANGRVAQIEYPSGLIVKQTYTAWAGHAASVTDAGGATTYWKANSRMLDGQISSMGVGPHTTTKTYDPLGRVATIATAGVQNATYAFDEVGNLTRRVDATVGQADETYGYDLLNRLTKANAITIASYDDAGNITSRSGTGSYNYYAGTHRLANLNGGATNSYDANGNFVADGNRSVTSNAFNMPSRITGGGNTLDFAYDSSHARIQEVSSASGITNFVGSQFYEEQFRPDGSTYRRHYIATPEGVVALIVQRYRPQGSDTLLRYWHKDHLGSVAVITTDTALIVERFTYDVWGRRTQAYIATGEPLEERGYTGHETLDDVAVGGIGLVHMNGRIYDPFTGRFLSADPFIQSPLDGQSYNRYSYVLNNPLSFTDPTGFSWWTKWRRPIIAIAVAWAVGPAGFWAAQGGLFGAFAGVQIGVSSLAAIGEAQFLSVVAGGFAAGGIMGGNLESAIQGAFFAAVTFQIGTLAQNGTIDFAEKIAAHALVGCGRAAAAGGNCGSGALAAGFAEFAGPVLKANNADYLITRVVIGGIGSRIAGGSFESGATTAAFAYLFNEAPHSRESSVSLYGRYAADVGEIWCYLACLHLSVVISDQYSGVTLIQGEPDWPVRYFEGSALVSPSMSAEILARFQTNSVFGPVALPVPDGMSARAFADALVANASAFTPGSVSYRIPYLGFGYLPPGQYNSNSFASGLLQSVYGYVPAVNFGRFQAPGWGNPLPRQMFGGGG
jgi:RHS repeat-associated protein